MTRGAGHVHSLSLKMIGRSSHEDKDFIPRWRILPCLDKFKHDFIIFQNSRQFHLESKTRCDYIAATSSVFGHNLMTKGTVARNLLRLCTTPVNASFEFGQGQSARTELSGLLLHATKGKAYERAG